jgi:hypothetical protein
MMEDTEETEDGLIQDIQDEYFDAWYIDHWL